MSTIAIRPQFEPEYVNIFGVPFTFLPHEGGESGPPKPPTPKTAIEPVPEKVQFEIKWPNIIRIEHVYRPRLSLDWERVDRLELNASETAQVAELAQIVDGKPDVSKLTSIDLEPLAREYRTQKIIFKTARDVYDLMKPSWSGSRESLIAQLVKLVELFVLSDRLVITPPLFYQGDTARRLIITLNMTKVVQHVWDAVRVENTERLEPVFDRDHPIRSATNMPTWYTGKPCHFTDRSHVNMCVFDSTLGGLGSLRARPQPVGRRLGQERPPGLRGALRLPGCGAKVPSRLHHPTEDGQHAGPGDQGAA